MARLTRATASNWTALNCPNSPAMWENAQQVEWVQDEIVERVWVGVSLVVVEVGAVVVTVAGDVVEIVATERSTTVRTACRRWRWAVGIACVELERGAGNWNLLWLIDLLIDWWNKHYKQAAEAFALEEYPERRMFVAGSRPFVDDAGGSANWESIFQKFQKIRLFSQNNNKFFTWFAINPLLCPTSVQPRHSHFVNLHRFLCPLSAAWMPCTPHRAHFGSRTFAEILINQSINQ